MFGHISPLGLIKIWINKLSVIVSTFKTYTRRLDTFNENPVGDFFQIDCLYETKFMGHIPALNWRPRASYFAYTIFIGLFTCMSMSNNGQSLHWFNDPHPANSDLPLGFVSLIPTDTGSMAVKWDLLPACGHVSLVMLLKYQLDKATDIPWRPIILRSTTRFNTVRQLQILKKYTFSATIIYGKSK